MMKKVKTIFVAIVILAFILRFFQLGKVPVALEWDEVALGYDAYSILHTGRDQFGQFLPLTFRSIDDYKPPLYIYMAVPMVKIFGLSEFAARLPSAIFGVIAVVLTYYLVLELFSQRKESEKHILALMSALFLAISPWHLQFSRAAFETNLSVTVTIAAVLCFYKGIRGNNKLFLLSSFFFGLALFSYHSTRVVTPLLLLSLFTIFHKRLPAIRNIMIFFVIYAVFVYFFIPIATSSDSQIRFRVTNILNAEKYQEEASRQILQDEKVGGLIGGKIFHNRRLATLNYDNVQKILGNYLSHFSPKFLFVSGDVPLHHAPGFGMMYFFDLPLLLIGVAVYLLKYRSRESLILAVWFLLGPIPASVTWQVPHAVRMEIILPTLQIFSALGLFTLLLFIQHEFGKRSRLTPFLFLGMVLISVYGIGAYLHQYYLHTNIELSKNWLYGRKEAAEYTEKVKSLYDKVIVSLKVDMPLNFWLFYTKYPPELYLEYGGTVSGGFAEESNKFDKYEFRNFQKNDFEGKNGHFLLVGIPEEFAHDLNVKKEIDYLDGTKALKIVESKIGNE